MGNNYFYCYQLLQERAKCSLIHTDSFTVALNRN